MKKKSLIPSDIFKSSPGHRSEAKSFIQHATSPDLPREMARDWLSQLSVEELEQEKAWLETLIQDKKDGK